MRNSSAARHPFRAWSVAALAAICLGGCATKPTTHNQLPGDVLFYTIGSLQDEEYFTKNVKRAQSTNTLYAPYRVWEEATAAPALAARTLLRTYHPLSVRWELKDGRQFVADSIDIAGIMKDFLELKDVQMQWQREQRKRAIGDFDPSLVYEVREDEVLIKWVVRLSDLSPEQRGKELPHVESYQYLVATVKGVPATGLDFNKQIEVVR